jgi:hypothetical protein
MKTMVFILLTSVWLFAQNVVEISVKGISNQQNDGAQQDRLEAILDAKRQACEKAGMTIESTTTMENFQIVYDLVETQAASVLLPGFQLVEIGYVQDGTYQVVLTGKIKIMSEEESISTKEIRYAKSLKDSGKHAECEAILQKYIDSDDPAVSAELKEEAFYYFLKWGYAWDIQASFQKFAAYYPGSKYLSNLESFAAFAAKPIHAHNQIYKTSNKDWQKIELVHDNITFSKKINAAADTIIFKDFQGQTQTILLYLSLFSEEGKEPRTAYRFIISYFNGDVTQPHPEAEVKVVEDRFRVFQAGASPTFQHSSSGGEFVDFKWKSFELKGDVPVGKGPYEQSLRFEIHQISF